jgi:hypothetical protein
MGGAAESHALRAERSEIIDKSIFGHGWHDICPPEIPRLPIADRCYNNEPQRMEFGVKHLISALALAAALIAPAAAQTAAFDQGQRDGYNGGMSPGAMPGWSYANGRQQGEEQRGRDDQTNLWGGHNSLDTTNKDGSDDR